MTRTARILAAVAIAAAATAAVVPAPAQATTFNIPRSAGGTAAQSDVFNHQVRLEIDRAKRHDVVYVSTYGLSSFEVRDAILRAYARGVKTRVLSWSGDTFRAMDKLQAVLGTNRKASSWAIRCDGSCATSGHKGTHHLKAVTNETTGRTIIASGNLTGTGDVKWNAFSSCYDPRVRVALERWILALSADRKVRSPKAVTSRSCHWKVEFLPGAKDRRAEAIRDVDCRPYKLNGRTVRPVVEIASMIWTNARDEVAVEAGRAKKRGCDVRAAISAPQTDKKPAVALRKYGVPTRDTYAAKVKMHAKPIIIRSRKVNVVLTGTTNLGGNGSNTNVILTIDSKAEVDQHMRWFDLVTRHAVRWK